MILQTTSANVEQTRLLKPYTLLTELIKLRNENPVIRFSCPNLLDYPEYLLNKLILDNVYSYIIGIPDDLTDDYKAKKYINLSSEMNMPELFYNRATYTDIYMYIEYFSADTDFVHRDFKDPHLTETTKIKLIELLEQEKEDLYSKLPPVYESKAVTNIVNERLSNAESKLNSCKELLNT